MQIDRSPEELSYLADVVVVGTAGDVAVEPFTANAKIPASARREPGYAEGAYARTAFVVGETLKGTKRPSVSVAWLHSLGGPDGSIGTIGGSDDLALVRGKRYVLFLSKGTALWTGHHLAIGAQAIGEVDGATVRFRSGKSMPLDQVVSKARRPVAPSTQR